MNIENWEMKPIELVYRELWMIIYGTKKISIRKKNIFKFIFIKIMHIVKGSLLYYR